MIDEINVASIYNEMRQDFRMAKNSRFTSRLTGVSASGSGADYHYQSFYEYLHTIERARFYERNDMVVGQGVRRLVSNVVQGGFNPDPQTGDKELNAVFKDLWREWTGDANICHSEGEFTFNQIERLTLRSVIRDGDIWHLLRDDGTIQAVEGHRPRTPNRTKRNVVHGVFMDNDAKRQEVWIPKEDLGYYAQTKYADIERYRIRDEEGYRVVLQVYFPERFSQRRGISAFCPTSDCIGMHDDLEFSTLVKAQLASLLVILREQELDAPDTTGPPIGGNLAPATAPQNTTGQVSRISGIEAGVDYLAPKGQTVKGFAPRIPNPEFFEHTMLLLTFIAINLDLPLQVLLLDPQKSSFSSWRGAIDQARVRFREIQADLTQQLHDPVYSWKIRQWASASRALRKMIGNNPNWMKVNWKKPKFAYIEPEKDAKAERQRSEGFLSSMRRIQGDRGEEWGEVAKEIVEDRGLLITEAIEFVNRVKKVYGDDLDLTWRDVLSTSLGGTSNTSVSRSIVDEE